MKFVEKVGSIEVYTTKNDEKDITVTFINGTDVIMSEVYFTSNENRAIEDLFMRLDTYTEEWLWLNYLTEGLEKISDNLYRIENDYFKKIDDTRFFKHFDHEPMM